MKKVAILLLCFFTCLQASYAQTPANTDYTIVNVKGIIKSGDKQLAKGQKVKVTDNLKFSKDAMMLITDATKTRNIVIEPSTVTATKVDVPAPLSTFLNITKKVPAVKPNQSIVKTTEEIGQFFKEKLFIVGSEVRITLIGGFEMDDNHFFYVNGKYGTEVMNKQLDFKDSLLYISKTLLTDATSKPVPDAEVMFIDVKMGESISICKPNVEFIDNLALKPKLQSIVDMYVGTGITKDNMPKEIAVYIMQYYGKTDYDNLKLWIDKNLKIT